MNSNCEETRFDQISEEEFPFDTCITCDFRDAKRCAGPNASNMTPARRCDFFQKLQRHNKNTMRNGASWSYDYIAAQTNGVSRSTVIRSITDANYVPGVDTYSEVFRVLFDGSVNQYPCGIHSQEKEIAYVDSPETLEILRVRTEENLLKDAQIEELKRLQADQRKAHEDEISKLRTYYEDDIKEYQALVEHMRTQIDRKDEQIARKDDYIDKLWAERKGPSNV